MSLQLLSLSLSPRLSNWRPSKRILRSLQQDIHETLRQTHLSASWWMMSPVIPMLSVVAVAPHCVMAWLCFFHELCSSIAVPDIHPIRVRSLLLSTVNISERFRTSILDHYRLVYYIIMYIFYYILLYHIYHWTPLIFYWNLNLLRQSLQCPESPGFPIHFASGRARPVLHSNDFARPCIVISWISAIQCHSVAILDSPIYIERPTNSEDCHCMPRLKYLNSTFQTKHDSPYSMSSKVKICHAVCKESAR
jgi:hypothetical protein